MQRVEAGSAVDPGMDVATPGAHRKVEVSSAARAEVESRKPAVEHRGVEDDAGIGAALVLPDPRSGTLAPDLLLGVAEETDVHGQCAFDRKAARCFEQEPELPLVVGHAAAVEPTVANGRLERRAVPELERRRRLHVDVPVAEDGRGAAPERVTPQTPPRRAIRSRRRRSAPRRRPRRRKRRPSRARARTSAAWTGSALTLGIRSSSSNVAMRDNSTIEP